MPPIRGNVKFFRVTGPVLRSTKRLSDVMLWVAFGVFFLTGVAVSTTRRYKCPHCQVVVEGPAPGLEKRLLSCPACQQVVKIPAAHAPPIPEPVEPPPVEGVWDRSAEVYR